MSWSAKRICLCDVIVLNNPARCHWRCPLSSVVTVSCVIDLHYISSDWQQVYWQPEHCLTPPPALSLDIIKISSPVNTREFNIQNCW